MHGLIWTQARTEYTHGSSLRHESPTDSHAWGKNQGYVGTAGEAIATEGERFNSNSTNISFDGI
jgi:hypothetical protein